MNFRSSGDSIFLEIQTFRIYIMYTISRWIFGILKIHIFCKSAIPCIYNVHNFSFNLRNFGYSISLEIRTFRKFNEHNFPLNLRSSRQSIFLQIQTFCTNIMYTIFCRIYAVLDIQFFCKSRHVVHKYCTKFPFEFSEFRIFNFSTNPNISYI